MRPSAPGSARGRACSRCSPAACRPVAATASSPAPGGCSSCCEEFRFGPAELGWLREQAVVSDDTLDWLEAYRFSGSIRGYREGELYFPGSPVLVVEGTVRRGGAARDARAERAQLRLGGRERGRPHGRGGRRSPDRRDGVAPHRRALAPSRRRGPPTSPDSRRRATSRPAAPGACRRWAPPRTRSPCCSIARRTRSAPRSTRWGSARRCSSTPTRSRMPWSPRCGSPAPRSARCASTRATSPCSRARGARAAGRARRDGHPHHRDQRPRRVRDRGAPLGTGRLVRGRHRRSSPDREPRPPASSTSSSPTSTTTATGCRSASGRPRRRPSPVASSRCGRCATASPHAEHVYVEEPPAEGVGRALLVDLVVDGEPVEWALGPEGVLAAREHHAAAIAELPPGRARDLDAPATPPSRRSTSSRSGLLQLVVDLLAVRADRELLGVTPRNPDLAAQGAHRLAGDRRLEDLLLLHVVRVAIVVAVLVQLLLEQLLQLAVEQVGSRAAALARLAGIRCRSCS